MGVKERLKKIYDTVAEGGLFGSKNPNIWDDAVRAAEDASARKTIFRNFKNTGGGGITDDHLTAYRQLSGGDQPLTGSKLLQKFADETGLESRNIFSKALLNSVGTIKDLPGMMFAGTPLSRASALRDFWEHGLLGKGGPVRNALRPGDSWYALRDAVKNKEKVTAGDVVKGVGGLAKPLIVGGAAYPAYRIGDRIVNPDYYKEVYGDSVPGGIAKDVGWFAGMTAGVPFGIPGIQAGTMLGTGAGKLIGSGIDKYREKAEGLLNKL